MTEGAPRDRAGYLATLVVTRWALVRRPSVSLPALQPPNSPALHTNCNSTTPAQRELERSLQALSPSALPDSTQLPLSPTPPGVQLRTQNSNSEQLSTAFELPTPTRPTRFRRANAASYSPRGFRSFTFDPSPPAGSTPVRLLIRSCRQTRPCWKSP